MGYGGGGKLHINTDNLDFGYVAVGKTKELPLIIHNGKDTDTILNCIFLGSLQLSITAIFPLTISSKSDVTIPISYNPDSMGLFESTLQIDSDDLHGTTYIVLPITGYGVPSTNGVIHVPSQAPSIQAAIDASTNGDIIMIAPGTYYENAYLADKSVVIRSSDGPESTIIDANGGIGIDISFQGGGKVELKGLSIKNCDNAIHLFLSEQ